VAAGRRNNLKRQGLTAAGRERLRAAALAHRPWQYSTGPRTPEGKAQAAANGKARQTGPTSVRERRAATAAARALAARMASVRRALGGQVL
jgi:hypothetical protein